MRAYVTINQLTHIIIKFLIFEDNLSIESWFSEKITTMASLSTRRILIVVVCLCVLFVLGFVIGWVSSPCDEHSPPDYTMKYIARKRKENEKVKEEFNDQLMKILSAKEIGEHLR